MSMGVVDTIMVGPLGPAAIGVSGMSNSLFFAVAVFGMGVMLGLDALVAKSYGAAASTTACGGCSMACWSP
jgi:MATE family multidrug resistance protein